VDHDETTEERRLSRRSMIKGAAGGAAAMWAAPAVTTLGSRAYAGESPAPACDPGTDFTCTDDVAVECGNSGEVDFCYCDSDVDTGATACVEDVFCDGDVTTCASAADCPPGYICATNCCGQVCMAPCGTNAVAAGAAGARVAGGKSSSGR
jgi:hypothetical protein